MAFRYKMVQIPAGILIARSRGQEAAEYLQTIVDEWAATGWDFYRVDAIAVAVKPGCLGAMFGQKPTTLPYYVVTFRRLA